MKTITDEFRNTTVSEIDLCKYGDEEITIEDYAYEHTDIEFLFIPKTVVEIGKEAFARCYNLLQVVFENGTKYIPSNIFNDCDIHMMQIPASVELIDPNAFEHVNVRTMVFGGTYDELITLMENLKHVPEDLTILLPNDKEAMFSKKIDNVVEFFEDVNNHLCSELEPSEYNISDNGGIKGFDDLLIFQYSAIYNNMKCLSNMFWKALTCPKSDLDQISEEVEQVAVNQRDGTSSYVRKEKYEDLYRTLSSQGHDEVMIKRLLLLLLLFDTSNVTHDIFRCANIKAIQLKKEGFNNGNH